MISCARISVSTACRNASTSNCPSGPTYFIRFNDDRLHAESSRNMYSEHGLDALIRAVFLHGCHRLTVVSNCIPGSPHWCVASEIWRMMSRALCRFTGWPVATALVHQSSSRTTASMKSSVARTELLAFWKKIDPYASPSSDESYPASTSVYAFFSSFALHQMNFSTSGWSTFKMTIFAARRVLPPDLITPANASKPFMKDSGPDARPPPERIASSSRSADRFDPVPEPHLNSMPSVFARSRIDSSESFTDTMKHAEHCGRITPDSSFAIRSCSFS